MLEARQRTALDGKVWWCIFNAKTHKWSTDIRHGKYSTKKACKQAILLTSV